MKKHCYEIVINKPVKKHKEFTYDYSSNKGKGIKLQISNNAIRIIAHLSSLYENDEVVASTNNIFSDAIKKALLLHLVIHSKNIHIKTMSVLIDGVSSEIPLPDGGTTPPLHSLVIANLARKTPENWSDSLFLEAVISQTRSNQDTRWASLYAALCAKSKTFEIERFIYLWMSFNGIYNYFSAKIKPLCPLDRNGKKQNISESHELTWLLKLYDLGQEHIYKNESKRVANDVIAILKTSDITQVQTADDLSDDLKKRIEDVLVKKDGRKYNLSAYGYLLVSFAYYFRCNVFHAGKPLPLFCYKDEIELKCLHLINTLLEEVIDSSLSKIFDDAYVNANFGEKFEQIAKTFQKGG